MKEPTLWEKIESLAGEVTLPKHLAGLPDHMANGARFEAIVTKGVAALLGFEPDKVFYGARATNSKDHSVIEFDAIAIERSVAHLVIEVQWKIPRPAPKTNDPIDPRRGLPHMAERVLRIASAQAAVAVNPLEILAVNANGESCRFKMADPSSWAESRLREVAGRKPGAVIPPNELFQPQLEPYLRRIDEAVTNDQKKKSLEAFAQFILGASRGVAVKYTDMHTETSEIDIVCEVDPRIAPLCLTEFGRFFLVECKNWKKPVGADSVRDFLSKVRTSKCKLGLLFSKNGITGQNSASDARGEILLAYQQPDWAMILVISERDWMQIADANEFLEWLDVAIDAARFRFKP